MIGRIVRRVREGEAVAYGTCPVCKWEEKIIFEIDGGERELAYFQLQMAHEETKCSGVITVKEESELSAPSSYLDHRRPQLLDALEWEGGATIGEAIASLERKGYYTPPPRPWVLGFSDQGMGHGDFAILDRFGDLVVSAPNRVTAQCIIEAVNAQAEKK